jgi:hypothetical protein
MTLLYRAATAREALMLEKVSNSPKYNTYVHSNSGLSLAWADKCCVYSIQAILKSAHTQYKNRGGQMSEEDLQTVEFLPINDILARFPVIGQTIFDYLDDQSLKRSREVHSAWSTFLSQNPFYWIRMAKSYLQGQDEFSDDWKNIFDKIPVEIARKFTLGIAHLHRSESTKLGCLNPGNLLFTDLFLLKLLFSGQNSS